MNIINEQPKRHTGIQNDISYKTLQSKDIFKSPQERALFATAKKVEKITGALYLVTDVMEPTLPLCASLREESLGLSNACYQLLTKQRPLNNSDMTAVIARIEQVISLVQIGRIAHHISDMNATILIKELELVLVLVLGEARIVSDMNELHPDHAKAQPVVTETTFRDTLFDTISRERKIIHTLGDQKNQSTISPQITKDLSINDISKRHQNDINDTSIKNDIKTTFKKTYQSINDIDRKKEIVNVIKTNKNASINDIKIHVSGVSEKTIQRDIAALVLAGVITKQGDKRWATYHVV